MYPKVTRGDRVEVTFRTGENCLLTASFAEDVPIVLWDMETEKWRPSNPWILALDATDDQMVSFAFWAIRIQRFQ
jgi:hypothetical protein